MDTKQGDTVTHEYHTVEAVMARHELSEDEAYFVLRFAGHWGYSRAIRLLINKPVWWHWRKWLIWFGGWEMPALSQWDRNEPAWRFRHERGDRLAAPYPVSLFDHRLTFYGWGWNVRLLGRGWLVWSKDYSGRKFYWSPNGTPSHKQARILWRSKYRPPSGCDDD